ncbi:Gfo/Idh/MocA family protein [Brachybacterium sp. DNPG3]
MTAPSSAAASASTASSAAAHSSAPGASGTDAPVRIVVVGAGAMGRAWIGTVLRSRGASLVGVVDMIEESARRAVEDLVPADERDGVAVGTDLLDVAARSGAEAVVDVTIPAAHHQVTADALHAGLAILGEKPCAATLAEAVSLAGHAETTGRLFMVSQSRRHNPHLREARRLADALGGAGIVRTRFSRAPRFGGFREEMAHPLIVDMAIHAFDAARVLVDGDPVSVDAVSFNPAWSWYDGDAAASVTIRYSSGAVHVYEGSWASPGRETSWNGEWSLSCPQGTVEWDGDAVPSATVAPRDGSDGAADVEDAAGAADAAALVGREPGPDELWELDSSLDEFCRALRAGTVPEAEVHDNVWTQAIVEAAVRSADEHRRVLLDELLDEALAAARAADAADGRSRALEAWNDGRSGLAATGR